MSKKCVVCRRIPAREVFAYGHRLFNGVLNKQMIHELCVEAVKCINYADGKNRVFFCSRPSKPLLGGLFYALTLERGMPVPDDETNIGSVRVVS